jgi:signal transduction histidine kinase
MNAIQSMDEGGRLMIQVDKERGNYLLSVQDTGCGISKENVKKIFNPFFTTKEKGTGLGLSIVRKIIEGHGGRIEIESQEEEGTKVTVQLPKKGQAGMGDLWKRS